MVRCTFEHQSTKSRVSEFERTKIKFASRFLAGRNLWRTEQYLSDRIYETIVAV